jgi:hypothetical protein
MSDRCAKRREVVESLYRCILSYIQASLGCQLDDFDVLLDKLLNADEWKRYERLLSLMDMQQMDDQTVIYAGLLALKGLPGSGVLPLIRRLSHAVARGRDKEREVDDLKEKVRALEAKLKEQEVPGPAPTKWREIFSDSRQNIFRFLSDRKKTVAVDGNFATPDAQCRLPYLIDETYQWADNKWYWSKEENFSFVLFDFGEHLRVKVTAYQLQSTKQKKGAAHPKSWSLQGSNVCEEGKWVTLSDCRERSELNGESRKFREEIENSETFRFIRLKQLEQNWGKKLLLCFANIALYGSVMSSDPGDWTS